MPVLRDGIWLIVEDDDNDFFLLQRACNRGLSPQPVIHRESDGLDAKQFLSDRRDAPKLIVSDLKMPRMDGLDFLKWVRQRDPKARLFQVQTQQKSGLLSNGRHRTPRRELGIGAPRSFLRIGRVVCCRAPPGRPQHQPTSNQPAR